MKTWKFDLPNGVVIVYIYGSESPDSIRIGDRTGRYAVGIACHVNGQRPAEQVHNGPYLTLADAEGSAQRMVDAWAAIIGVDAPAASE